MTTRVDEDLSAFVDGELSDGTARSLLASLREENALREQWHRYHLIGETLRSGLPDQLDLDLAARVRQQLEAEPAILVPRRRSAAQVLHPYLKQVASLAIAAGVAVAAILVAPSLMQDEPAMGPAPQVAQNAQPAAAAPVMLTSTSDTISPSGQRSQVDQRLDEYLVNHYEHSAIPQVQGVLPYVRIVGFSRDSEQ